MKRTYLCAACLALVMLLVAGSQVFADETTMNLQSIVLQTFDAEETQEWFVLGSRFTAEGYPLQKLVNTWPISLFGTNPKDKEKLRVLGVAMEFMRKGYNWVDIVPGTMTKDGDKSILNTVEIPLPGRVKAIDMWVWSPGMNYYAEVYVRDYTGIVHVIPLGELNFQGWKNLRANVPESIPQSKKYLPHREGLGFVKIRIWSRPAEVASLPIAPGDPEYMKAIYFYFDQIKIMTDTYETLFDGDNLVSEDMMKETWGSGK